MNLPRPLLAAPALLLAGCAGMQVNRPAPGVIAQGAFTPQRPAAAVWGNDPLRTCPVGGAFKLLTARLAELQKSGAMPAVFADGRLCGAAEAWLGWDQPNPPESVYGFVAAWFGLPTPQTRMLLDSVETEDDAEIFERLVDPIVAFAKSAAVPRIGLATLRKPAPPVRGGMEVKGSTKVVLLMQDGVVDVDSLPRALPVGGQATLSGRFPGALENPKLLICDSEGKLLLPTATPGKEFRADLKCGPKPGRIQVEIRGEVKGAPTIAGSFPVACGTPLPASVAVPVPSPAAPDLPAQERRLFEQVNAERAALGLFALVWHEELAKLARTLSEEEREQLARGAHLSVSPTEQLKKADIQTPLALFNNPAVARSFDEAVVQYANNPVLRCNALSTETTHAGVGVATSASADGSPLALVTELFIKVLPPVDPVALRAQLKAAVLAKRNASPATKTALDAPLDEVAQKYAEALAASAGALDNAGSNAIISPLYKGYKNIDIIGGAKNDPLTFADEPSMMGKGEVLGLGVAQGNHPVLGKNAVYSVALLAIKREEAPKAAPKKRR